MLVLKRIWKFLSESGPRDGSESSPEKATRKGIEIIIEQKRNPERWCISFRNQRYHIDSACQDWSQVLQELDRYMRRFGFE